MFKTNTDWTRNKKSAAIICTDADGNISEITLARFLADSDENTIEKFNKFKALSDELFYGWDRDEREQAENEMRFESESEEFASPSLEETLVDRIEEEAQEAYAKKKAEMTALVPSLMDKLTPIQRRRYRLHFEDGLTGRRIAELEGTTHVAVLKSIRLAQKKIDKCVRQMF